MAYLDDVNLPGLMPDPSDPVDFARSMANAQRLTVLDQENRARGLYPTGTIPAVPYIFLLDNCYGGVIQNLAGGMAQQQLLSIFADIQRDALVLYATAPGRSIGDFGDPTSKQSGLPVGALARRLLSAIARTNAARPSTLFELRNALFAPNIVGPDDVGSPFALDPPIPYSLSNGGADLIDLALPSDEVGGGMDFEKRFGTANQAVECCGQ